MFNARDKYNLIDRSVDRAKSVFTKTIDKLTKANAKLDDMVTELDDEIAEKQAVLDMAKDKKKSNNKMIDKINSLMD